MPPEGVPLWGHDDILSFEEMLKVTKTAVDMGIDKVRVTGGEPLVRRGIVQFVNMLSNIDGIRDLAMTTNGTLLAPLARQLHEAGLHRLNISLDTLDPEKYRQITRVGDINQVLDGIEAAQEAGFAGTKLNCVIHKTSLEPDAMAVRQFAIERDLEARFIRQMDIQRGEFWVVDGGTGGDCAMCNRLRLTSCGMVKPCLFSDISFSVRELGAKEALTQAVHAKPASGHSSLQNKFYAIGG